MWTTRLLVCIYRQSKFPQTIFCLLACYTLQKNELALSIWMSVGRCFFQKCHVLKLRTKKKLLNSCQQSIFLGQAGFRQPDNACVVCVQCVRRGLTFSNSIMSTKFTLTWFSDMVFFCFVFSFLLTKLILCQQPTSTVFKIFHICTYLEVSIKNKPMQLSRSSIRFISSPSFAPYNSHSLLKGRQTPEWSRCRGKACVLSLVDFNLEWLIWHTTNACVASEKLSGSYGKSLIYFKNWEW